MDKDDTTCGIFNSPSRGLVFYNLKEDEFTPVEPSDSRLNGTEHEYKPQRIHTNFGNMYLFFSEMGKTPYMAALRTAFGDSPELYQKVLAHITHDCLRNKSSIKCGEYLDQSALSYILTNIPESTLDCDTSYYKMLSDDRFKTAYFKALVSEMRKTHPDFGRACYVDSTPLPGEAENNPYNELCSHGTDGSVIQARMVLVLDYSTNIPVWFEIIASNVLDKSTILSVTKDVKTTLDITIDTYDLDAGYARKELFEYFNKSNSSYVDEKGITREHTVLIRMPATNGYPRDSLYIDCKPHFYTGRYSFDYEHHTFFGERVDIELFGYPEYAFVIIDKTQAESLLRQWREDHLDEWNEMSDSLQDWYQVKDGFFVLIGNKDQTAKDALIEYRGRTQIESFFRDAKTCAKFLPVGKWSKETVLGKIFHDVIETTIYREYRKRIAPTNMTMSSLIVNLDSWDCFQVDGSLLEIKTPKLQVREILAALGYSVPAHIDLNDLRKEIIEGTEMERIPVTIKRKQKKPETEKPLSPEEKIEKENKNQIDRLVKDAKNRLEKAEKKADQQLAKAIKAADEKLKKTIARAQRNFIKEVEKAKGEKTKLKINNRYEETIAMARTVYEQAKKKAQTECDQSKATARKEYERFISEQCGSTPRIT